MSATALVFDVGTGDPDGTAERGPALGVASVHVLGVAHVAARCSCGWGGRRRVLKAAAEQDAWAHCLTGGCAVSCPLVFDW